jgi:predicted CxxxxCH...CXXCH cytochrome family protein
VNLSKPIGGKVVSTDGRIDCGLGATTCGDALGQTRYDWTQTVSLNATADTAGGYTFVGWAGDCRGTGTCTLYAGADRTIAAVFKSAAPPAGDGGEYGVTYVVRVSKPVGGTVTSTGGEINCGAAGGSCRGVFAWAATATLVATPDAGLAFGTWAGDCNLGGACTLDTSTNRADKTVAAVFGPVGLVQHGRITDPSLHGRAFFDFAAGVPTAFRCTGCHGSTYAGMGIAPSCNACHAKAGWTTWVNNCAFCHGAKNPYTQAGWTLAARPDYAAPPDDVAGRLSGVNRAARTGAHQAHLLGRTSAGATFAPAFTCATCHTVPSDVSHIQGGVDPRAPVVLTGAGQATLPANLGTYNQATGTCTTYCHGSTLADAPAAPPSWAGPVVVCGSCHGVPPTVNGHPQVAMTACAGCHPETMNPDGTLNAAGGKHIDGLIEATGHAYIASPSLHGPLFFDAVAANPVTPYCTGCHGTDYGGMGKPAKNCNACHTAAGWALPWQDNCSFCHGTKTKGGYASVANPLLAAPPDDIQGRLGGTNSASKTGAHKTHLTGTDVNGQSYANPFTCATCHTVPGGLSHINGASAQATVTLRGAGQASLPASLGTYSTVAGNCATYCHGEGMVGGTASDRPWSGTITQCNSCHGIPPDTGKLMFNSDWEFWASGHVLHTTDGLGFSCDVCHFNTTTLKVVGSVVEIVLKADKSSHVNGVADVVFAPANGGGSWNAATGDCTVACHSSLPRNWRQ